MQSSLNMIAAAACKEELGEENRTDFKENSLQQEQEQDKRKLVKGGKGKGKSTKEKGGAYKPQPQAYRGKGEPNQLPNSAQRACRDKPEETKGKGQESNPSFKRELEHRGKSKRGEKKTTKKRKRRSLRSPQPRAYQGKGEHQLPNRARRACRDKLEPKGDKRRAKGKLSIPRPCKETMVQASAGRQGTQPKHPSLLVELGPASSTKSTNRRKLGAARAERSSFKETMETNLSLSGWLPTKVS